MHFTVVLGLSLAAFDIDVSQLASSARALSDAELDAALSALQREKRERKRAVVSSTAREAFLYAHKKTYATAEPIEAALFLQKYFGGVADKNPFQHHCNDSSLEQPQTNTVFGETGCYIEAPYGIIVEALCDVTASYNASRACLSTVDPGVFDLCSSTR